MKKISLFLTMLLLVASPAFSDVTSVEGTVDNIRPGSLVIDKWGDNLEVDLKVNGLTSLQHMNSLDDLTFGDKVHVYYQQEGKRLVATSIIKDPPNNETWL